MPSPLRPESHIWQNLTLEGSSGQARGSLALISDLEAQSVKKTRLKGATPVVGSRVDRQLPTLNCS